MVQRKSVSSVKIFGAVVVAVVLVFAATFTGGLLSSSSTTSAASAPGTRSSSTVSATSTTFKASSTSENLTQAHATNSSLGLELRLGVNSTVIPSEEAVNVTFSILNTKSSVNNVTASNDWPIQGLSPVPCEPLDPAGIAVLRGYYGMNNVTTGGAIPIWGLEECPNDLLFNGSTIIGSLRNVTSYSLAPASDAGNYSGIYVPEGSAIQETAQGVFPTRLDYTGAFYAVNNTEGHVASYNSLWSALPANYTVVAGDEWGQITLLHFEVVPSHNLPTVGNFIANGGGCATNNQPGPCGTSEFSGAFIFNCAAQAATPSGCTTQVPTSYPGRSTSYAITVWYPYTGQPGEPATANCMFSVPAVTSASYGYCLMVNSTSFVLSPVS